MAKILFAEDEPDIRDLLAFTLQFGGHEPVPKKNGAEVVEVAAEVAPDLILLDVRMPRMTGYEACKALKENPATEHIPVVFLSAKGQESEMETGIEAGAVAYLLKPFSPDELLERVKGIIATYVEGDKAPKKTADKAKTTEANTAPKPDKPQPADKPSEKPTDLAEKATPDEKAPPKATQKTASPDEESGKEKA